MLNIPTCEIEQIKLAKSTSDELYLKIYQILFMFQLRRTVAKKPKYMW